MLAVYAQSRRCAVIQLSFSNSKDWENEDLDIIDYAIEEESQDQE
jgi:hypothetical protein